MNQILRKLVSQSLCGVLLFCLTFKTTQNVNLCADEAAHKYHPLSGRKNPSPGPDDIDKFIRVDRIAKTVFIPLAATFNDANHGMNFNGHYKGRAIYSVPKGWKVTIHFKNMSPVPHSAVVVEQVMARKLQVGEPYFDGASTTDPMKGLKKDEEFTFVVDDIGKFAIACGFPAHSASGHWIALNVTKEGETPSLKLPASPL